MRHCLERDELRSNVTTPTGIHFPVSGPYHLAVFSSNRIRNHHRLEVRQHIKTTGLSSPRAQTAILARPPSPSEYVIIWSEIIPFERGDSDRRPALQFLAHIVSQCSPSITPALVRLGFALCCQVSQTLRGGRNRQGAVRKIIAFACL